MPELLLHYIWQRGLFMHYPQSTTDGRVVRVFSVGYHNTDAGPDFTSVRLRLGEIELVGNVEIHLSSSDWYRHRHHLDPAYDSVILHVVRHADRVVTNSQGQSIPQLELAYQDDQDYLQQLTQDALRMDSALSTHACAKHLIQQPSLLTQGWRRTMLLRRLDCKQRSIERLLTYFNNDLAQAMYITLAHHFGFHINGAPMELMAIQTPLPILRKHKDNLFQLTALLLGQAGLLREDDFSDETTALRREYTFLQHKYTLSPIDPVLWKHSRLRPHNAPEVRVRQLAQLLYQSDFLFSRAMDATSLDDLRSLFTPLGSASIDSLIINVVLPYRYARGHHDWVLQILDALPPENNTIIRQWQSLGQSVHSAADTQALLHLYQSCCQSGHCLNCDVAYQIFL